MVLQMFYSHVVNGYGRSVKMAERGGSKTTLSDKDSQHLSDEKGADVVKKIKRDFDECAGIGKSVIEGIKASLLASSANFNKAKYAIPVENPYSKAYYYLEDNQVLAMLEVFDLVI